MLERELIEEGLNSASKIAARERIAKPDCGLSISMAISAQLSIKTDLKSEGPGPASHTKNQAKAKDSLRTIFSFRIMRRPRRDTSPQMIERC